MKEMTVESVFGSNAGIVWKTLNQNGSSNLANLMKTTSLTREEIYGALGWLGRENKIVVKHQGRAMIFSLRDEEAYQAVTDTTAEPASKARSKSRKIKPKIKKARSVKAPNKQTESPAVQSERVEEFMLH